MSSYVRNSGIRKVARQLAVATILCSGIAVPPVLAAGHGVAFEASGGDGEWPAPGTTVVLAEGEWPAPAPAPMQAADGEWPVPEPTPVQPADGEWPVPQG